MCFESVCLPLVAFLNWRLTLPRLIAKRTSTPSALMRRAGHGDLLKAEEEGPRSSSIIAASRFGAKN